MDGKFDISDFVVASEVVKVVHVINIVYLDSELLTLFKMVLDVKGLDPDGGQVVHDNLRHAYALPLVAHLLVEYHHTIGPGESVKIGQILTGKAKADGLHEATLSGADALIDSGKHGVVNIATTARCCACTHGSCVLMCSETGHSVTD